MRPALPLAALLWLAASTAYATDVYRWVDADGVVHLQDQPSPGAEKIRVEAAPTFKPPPLPTTAATAKGKPEKPAGPAYQSLEIVSPKQQETIWNTGGNLSVSIRPNPALKPGHAVRLTMDDQEVPAPSPEALEYQMTDVVRGVHVLRAEIVNDQGQALIASSPVTIFVRQASVLTPGGP